MSRIGISITKEVAFRDNQQEFSNVYYYGNGTGALPGLTDAEALLDQLVALEKTFHSSLVSFVHGRLWKVFSRPTSWSSRASASVRPGRAPVPFP